MHKNAVHEGKPVVCFWISDLVNFRFPSYVVEFCMLINRAAGRDVLLFYGILFESWTHFRFSIRFFHRSSVKAVTIAK